MNKIIVGGRLTKDVESVATASTTMVKFSLAVNGRKKADGTNTEFFNCTAFGKTAEVLIKYGTKGKMLFVTGAMQSRKWQDKIYWEVLADDVEFCGNTGGGTTAEKEKEKVRQTIANLPEIDEGDMPF